MIKIIEKIEEVKGNCDDVNVNDMMDELIEVVKEEWEKVGKKEGRKEEVLKVLERGDKIMISDIAKELGISNKNVSSQLSYLRSDGYDICTDRNGKKFLLSD